MGNALPDPMMRMPLLEINVGHMRGVIQGLATERLSDIAPRVNRTTLLLLQDALMLGVTQNAQAFQITRCRAYRRPPPPPPDKTF